MTARRGTIIVAGALASKPWNGGEAWVRLSWALGLTRLGYHVQFVEEIADEPARSDVAFFDAVVARFGLTERATLTGRGRTFRGLSRRRLRAVARAADLLVNLSGNLRDLEIMALPGRRIYVDLDPGYTQWWHVNGLLGEQLRAHDSFFTVGGLVGMPGCSIPSGGIIWRHVLPPVFLKEWPMTAPSRPDLFTTVASWRGGFGPVETPAGRYGVKAHEFRRLVDLPGRVGVSFEIALQIHPSDARDRNTLRENGWQLVCPGEVAGQPESYRTYIQRSGAEFSAAQEMYVRTRSGWFSDRSAHYLASGRPVLLQDTGFSQQLPVGRGLLAFTTVEEAVDGARAIVGAHSQHSFAARQLAETFLDSDLVLDRFLAEAA